MKSDANDEGAQIDINENPSAQEIMLHFQKLEEYMLDERPDLRRKGGARFASLTVKNDFGKIVAGAYVYSSVGTAVIECVWVDPKHRGRFLLKLCHQVLDVARQWDCDQVVGYSSSFLRTAAIILRFGAKPFAVLQNPNGFESTYYCLRLK